MLGLVETKVISLTSMGAASLVLGLLPLWLRGGRRPSSDADDCPRRPAHRLPGALPRRRAGAEGARAFPGRGARAPGAAARRVSGG